MVIMDEKDPGEGGASAAAAGLLHPFTPRAKLTWLGREGFASSLRLIDVAQRHSPHPLLITPTRGRGMDAEVGGVVMLAKNESQNELFRVAACEYPQDLELFTMPQSHTHAAARARRGQGEESAEEKGAGERENVSASESARSLSCEALRIRAGIAVHGSSYSKALWYVALRLQIFQIIYY